MRIRIFAAVLSICVLIGACTSQGSSTTPASTPSSTGDSASSAPASATARVLAYDSDAGTIKIIDSNGSVVQSLTVPTTLRLQRSAIASPFTYVWRTGELTIIDAFNGTLRTVAIDDSASAVSDLDGRSVLVEPRFGPDEYSAEIVDLAGGSIERLLVPGTEVEVVGRARTSADFVWIASLEKSESVIIDRRRPSSRRLVKGIVWGVVGDTVLAATLVQGQASPFVTGTANFAAAPFASITQPIALAALIDETSAVVVTKDAAVHRVDLLTGDERVLSVLSVQATALSAQGGWLAAGGDNGFQLARLSPWNEVTSSTTGRQPFFSSGSRCAVSDGGLVADAQSSTVIAEFGVEGTILSPSGCTVVSATGTDAIVDGQPPMFQFSRFYDALPDESGFVIASKAGDAAWINADGSVVTKLPAATDYLFAEQIPAG